METERSNGKVAISKVSVFGRILLIKLSLFLADVGNVVHIRNVWNIDVRFGIIIEISEKEKRNKRFIYSEYMSKVTHNKRYNSGNEDSLKLRGQKPQWKIYIFSSVSSFALLRKIEIFYPKNVRLNCDL